MDNRYMRVRQSVDRRLTIKYRDPQTKQRVVIGIQETDQGEITFRDEDGNKVGTLSSNAGDFETIPEDTGQEEAIVLILRGEKTRLWALDKLRRNHDDEIEPPFKIRLDESAQVVLRSQYLYGTLLVRDNLDNDRFNGSGPNLALEMFESTTRGEPLVLPGDTSDVVYE